MKGSRFIIYGLIDPRDGMLRYVGKSSYGLTRPRSHFSPSRLKERNHKEHWVVSVLRSGYRPEIVILEERPTAAELSDAERFHIAYFRFLGCPLTNATEGGEGAVGVRVSEATRAKMSAAGRGKKKSPQHASAIAAALKGHTVSGETRNKIGAKSAGNKNCVGRKLSDVSRKKMSESVKRTHPGRGRPRSEEDRLKISISARKRRRNSNGTFTRPTL